MSKFRIPFFLLVLIFIPFFTFLAIQWAKGYSFNLANKKFESRGILVANSTPDGAQVYINGIFETGTNNSLPLLPGSYSVEIKKDGFSSWKKELKIEKELVTQTNTYLFPAVPDLRPITYTGALNPVLSPDGSKIAYSSPATESARSGVWVADLVEFLGFGRGTKQIIRTTNKGRNFNSAQFYWSPDSRQLIVSMEKENFLVDPNQLTLEINLIDITPNLKSIKAGWDEDEKRITEAKLRRLPKTLPEILFASADNLTFSPDGEKFFYEATASAKIPAKLIPPLPASSTQKEEREIKPGKIYLYDLKEDRNFLIGDKSILDIAPKAKPAKGKITPTPTFSQSRLPLLSWFPTSRHLLWLEKEKISLIEYDGANKTIVFNGSFENSYVFPAPGANKIILLTSFGQEANLPANLYSINLR